MPEKRPPQHPTRREIRAIPRVSAAIAREEPVTKKPAPAAEKKAPARKAGSTDIADEVTADLTRDPRHDD